MKKRFFDPGFEFIFSVGIMAALAIPQLIFAQDKNDKIKEINITIKGNDTTFNGKNLKDMSAPEKQQALGEISKTVRPKGRLMPHGLGLSGMADSSRVRMYTFTTDSAWGGNRPNRMSFDIDTRRGGTDGALFDRPIRVRTISLSNSQNFDYNHFDKSGINTHIRYRVSEAFPDVMKKMTGSEKSTLDLQDLLLSPQFSTGKTSISFTLPAKNAEVSFTDTDGKVIWKEKAVTATFSKTFNLGTNGVYYLVIKQGSNTAMKRVVKE